MQNGRNQNSSGGTQTSAVTAGGHPGSGSTTDAETWDGTSWSEVANLNTARQGPMGAAGSNSVGIVCGGRNPPPSTNYLGVAETWDGTSWTEVADLSTDRYNGTAGGTGILAWAAGGQTSAPGPSGNSNATEEWTIPQPIEIKTFTAS